VSVREVDIDEAIRLRDAGRVVVDVREPFEWDAGHVAGALHIPLGQLADRIASELPDKSAPLLLYCRSGARSGRAARDLVANGYEDVANLKALIDGWPGRGGAWEVSEVEPNIGEAAASTPRSPA
jgi:rhodanese-related sulfurtransferase